MSKNKVTSRPQFTVSLEEETSPANIGKYVWKLDIKNFILFPASYETAILCCNAAILF